MASRKREERQQTLTGLLYFSGYFANFFLSLSLYNDVLSDQSLWAAFTFALSFALFFMHLDRLKQEKFAVLGVILSLATFFGLLITWF